MRIFATTGLIFLLCAVGLSREPNKSANVAKNKSDNQPAASTVTLVNNEASAPDTKRAENHAPPWYASPEWWLVILGFPTLFFIGVQSVLSRRSADAAKKSADGLVNSERAWILAELTWQVGELNVELGTLAHYGKEFKTTTVTTKLTCRNEGRSPAWVDSIWGRIDITPDGTIAKILDEQPSESELINCGHMEPIGPNASKSRTLKLSCNGHCGSRQGVSVYVLIAYHDVFGLARYTSAEYGIDGAGNLNRLMVFRERNKNT